MSMWNDLVVRQHELSSCGKLRQGLLCGPGMSCMTKKYRVTLTGEERAELTALISKGKANARKLAHARVLLQVDESEGGPTATDGDTAAALHLSTRTVERVRERFVEQGCEAALLPKPSTRRCGRAFDGAREARLLALACSARPVGKQRWTRRLLTETPVDLQIVDQVLNETVRQTLKKRTPATFEDKASIFL